MDISPVSLRSRCARCFRMIGAYVSGKHNMTGQLMPAKMDPAQKGQFHDFSALNPEITGPIIGPRVVAAMNIAILRAPCQHVT